MNAPSVVSHHAGPRRRLGLAVAATLAMVAVACSSAGSSTNSGVVSDDGPAVRTISAPSLSPGDVVPAPAGQPVLRVFGKIANTNGGDGLTLDISTIEKLGTSSFEVYEPYEKKRIRFHGVPLAALLDLAAPHATARQVHMVALDDYITDLSLDAAKADGLMLATGSADGSLLPVDHGGPTRLVFLDGAPGAEDGGDWIWSIATIEVR
jgi:hypothetical protein